MNHSSEYINKRVNGLKCPSCSGVLSGIEQAPGRRKNSSTTTYSRYRFRDLALIGFVLVTFWSDIGWAQVEPLAGTWKTWVLTSGSQLRLPPPPDTVATGAEIAQLRALEGERDIAALDLVNFWDTVDPGYRWIEMTYPLGLGNVNARTLALLTVAMYDATIAAWDSKYAYNRLRPKQVDPTLRTAVPERQSPSYPSEHAAVAGAASEVLAYLFPAQAKFYRDKADEAGRSRVLAGVNYPSDVNAGLELGRAVAARVIEVARNDGSSRPWTGTVPTGPCAWRSETGAAPAMPLAGTWRTWVLKSGDQLRPGPPPDCTSDAGKAEVAQVKNVVRTFNTNEAAFFWQSPRSLWTRIINQKIVESRIDDNPPRAARIRATAMVAWHDTVVACWDAKYTYWQIRPYQQGVTPLFPTPNHPSYPGAHACTSGAISATLAYLFPRDAEELNKQAEEAAESRIWAGIHYRSDTDVGLALGRSVAQLVIERVKKDGSQFESFVTGIALNPTSIQVGDSYTATITGINLNETTFFDIRFRRPGSSTDEIALNAQRGTIAKHTAAVGTPIGLWTITGVRSHAIINDFSGDFAPASATLTVTATQ